MDIHLFVDCVLVVSFMVSVDIHLFVDCVLLVSFMVSVDSGSKMSKCLEHTVWVSTVSA